MGHAFAFADQNAVCIEKGYRYTATDGICASSHRDYPFGEVVGCADVSKNNRLAMMLARRTQTSKGGRVRGRVSADRHITPWLILPVVLQSCCTVTVRVRTITFTDVCRTVAQDVVKVTSASRYHPKMLAELRGYTPWMGAEPNDRERISERVVKERSLQSIADENARESRSATKA